MIRYTLARVRDGDVTSAVLMEDPDGDLVRWEDVREYVSRQGHESVLYRACVAHEGLPWMSLSFTVEAARGYRIVCPICELHAQQGISGDGS